MFYKDQTNNSPKAKIDTENKVVNRPNELFRTRMVKLPVMEFNEKRDLIKQKCGWSRAVWFNKLHGITSLAPLEMEAIASIFETTTKELFLIEE